MRNTRIKHIYTVTAMLAMVLLFGACGEDTNSEFTRNQFQIDLIPGTVDGNTTTGTLMIRERNDGSAQIDITLENVLSGAQHPVHLHFGSLDDDGEVATFLTTLVEENGVGRSSTILTELDNGRTLEYDDVVIFNGSVKIHFESSGPLENELLGSTNLGINVSENSAYLDGSKSITQCNSNF